MQTGHDSLEKVVCETTVEIKNADGLHMRPAMQFVDVASRFVCDISVSNNENTVDGKSIMQMTMLAASCGTRLKIKAEGPDAQEASMLCESLWRTSTSMSRHQKKRKNNKLF